MKTPAQRVLEWSRSHPEHMLWIRAKRRAAKMNVPFDIEKSDIVIPKFCPILGIEMAYGVGGVKPNSPSLDRIVPSKGYIKGNVWVISFKANTIKNDATLEELELLVKALKNMSFGGD
jgi:hypothetical protein